MSTLPRNRRINRGDFMVKILSGPWFRNFGKLSVKNLVWTSLFGIVLPISAATLPNSVMDYPGKYPGVALATLSASNFEVQNDILSLQWTVTGKIIDISQFTDKAAGSVIAMKATNLFSLTLQDGTVITPAHAGVTLVTPPTLVSLTGNPTATRMSERDNGKQINAKFRYTGGGIVFDIDWTLLLRDGNCNVQQKFILTPVTGTFNLKFAKLIDVTLPNASVIGVDNGQTVVAGNVFLGIENPMALATVNGNNVGIQVEKASEPISAGSSLSYTQSIGIVPSQQLRRGFLYYVERERIHYRRPYLIYVSWYDLVGGGQGGPHSTTNCSRVINSIGTEMVTNRGGQFDAFLWDDNWDNLNGSPVWSISTAMFPDKFATIKTVAAKYGSKLGVWFSPFGGYGGTDQRIAANPTMETSGGRFVFSGPNYFGAVKNMSTDMVDNQGVNIFKIDGIGAGLLQTGPNAANRKDYEALLKYGQEMRVRAPEVFLYFTVGTWSSPYWFWFGDAIYRDNEDQPRMLTGNPRQMLISGRDKSIYDYDVKQNILHPISELMSHGFVFSVSTINGTPAATNLSDTTTRKETKDDMRWYFASGFSLQEMYLATSTIGTNTFFWDNLSRYAKWARLNNGILTDAHMIGSPAAGSVYGYASYSATKSIASFRNPNATVLTYAINPQSVFELPAGVSQEYQFKEIDGMTADFSASATKPFTITVQPYSVLVFEATPVTVHTIFRATTTRSSIQLTLKAAHNAFHFSHSFASPATLKLFSPTGHQIDRVTFKGDVALLSKPLTPGFFLWEVSEAGSLSTGKIRVQERVR